MLRWVNFGRRLGPKVGHYCTPIHISKKYVDPEYCKHRLDGLAKWAASGYSKMSIADLLKIREQTDNPAEIDNTIARKERYQHRKAKKVTHNQVC